MGSTDAVNLDPVANPITAGTYSFEKWQRFCVSALGGSSAIKNLKVWRTGALGGSDTHKTSARETSYANPTWATPVATVSTYTQTMPTTTPTNANVGIGGVTSGQITTASPTYSDYIVHQIFVAGGSTAGTTMTMNYQYDEIA
jgi:hypothetical protein